MKNHIINIIILASFFALFSCEDDEVIDTKPVAAFKMSEQVVVEGEAVIFTDLSFDENGSVETWNWNFGDGQTSTEQSPVYTYQAIGEYTVTLTVIDNTGQSNFNECSKVVTMMEESTATKNPEIVWAYAVPYKTNQSSLAVANDGTVYFGTDGKSSDPTRGDYNIFAVQNGSLKWGHLSDEVVRSSPSIADDGSIYIGDYNGDLFAFNPDGSQKWKATYKRFKYASPAIGADGTIYIGGGDKDNYFRAISPIDGNLKWEFEAVGKVRSTPAIDSDGIIYFSDYNTLYALNEDGTEKWRTVYGDYTACATVLIESAKTIYVADKTDHLVAFNMEDGTIKWKNNYSATDKTENGGPAVASDGTVYLGGEDGKMIAYNPEDGTPKWEFEAKGKIKAVPAIDNYGNLYFGDEAGFFYVIDDEGNTKWKATQLDGAISTSAAIGKDGTIYVLTANSDSKGTLYALRTKATGLAEEGWPMRSKNAAHSGR
ncbi:MULTISPECIES: PQQ-binding-like beta-propeller repeat protein [unclassified Carboxylicivirga]|uniref:outer membrane protein assembly factor BamB family protein n=1 Tax=Carboxylicivirga TaxID=1628153 RepID=UPI003D351696